MSTATGDGSPAAASLHENAAKILMYLNTQENERASTTDLRHATDLSAANISGHHALTLIERGYIEKVGSEKGNAPKDPNVYELTHRGRKEANRLLKENPAPMSDQEKTLLLRQLQERVDELEAIVEQQGASGSVVDGELAEQVNTNTNRLDQHDSRLDSIDSVLETAIDKIAEVREKVESST